VTDHRLDDDELAQLDRDGYVVREAAFDRAEVRAILDECEAVVEGVAGAERGRRYTVGSYVFEPDATAELMVKWEGDTDVVHGLEPFVHLSEPLTWLTLDPRFVAPMIELCGDPAPCLFTEKLNLKRPHHGGRNPLHQDIPYWGDAAHPDRTATAMLFLDDADLGNGTLEVVPGSHRDGQWRTRTDGDAFGQLEIDPDLELGIETVPIEVPAGSVAYFGSTLVHRSAPNTSDRQRRSILFSYQPAGAPHMRDLLRTMKESSSR
jgi:ectoine hydroxylase